MTTRRDMLMTGIGTAVAAATAAPARAQPVRKTFVLVHGAWAAVGFGGALPISWRHVDTRFSRRQ